MSRASSDGGEGNVLAGNLILIVIAFAVSFVVLQSWLGALFVALCTGLVLLGYSALRARRQSSNHGSGQS